MKTKRNAAKTKTPVKKPTTKRAAGVKAARPKAPKKNPQKLIGRFALDFAAMRGDMLQRAGMEPEIAPTVARAVFETNPAQLRLKASRLN